MNTTARLAIMITGDSTGGARALDDVGGKTSKLGGLLGKVGPLAVAGFAAAGAAAVAFGIKAVGAGGELQQSIGAINTVFKGNADQMHQWASTASRDVGLTANEFNSLGTLIGTQLKNGGTAMDQLGPKTNSLITLGADLSSMFGGSTADAVGALSSALKGERDPIERYGVSLNQAAIDAKAAELGFKKVGGSLSAEANQAATLALIMDQTKDAHGNFAKETNTWSHQVEVLKAGFGTFTEQLGLKMLPVLTLIVTAIVNGLLPAFDGFLGFIEPGLAALGAFTEGLSQGGASTEMMSGALGGLTAWVDESLMPSLGLLAEVLGIVFEDGSRVVGEFVTMAMSYIEPMIPTIMEIFGIIGEIVSGAIDLVTEIIFTGLGLVMLFWDSWGESIMLVVGTVFQAVIGVIRPALDTVRAIISTAVAILRGDWGAAWTGMGDIASGFIRTIVAIFSGAGSILVNAGKAIIDGFLRGLKNSFEAVKNFVLDIGGWIAAHKGPLPYDRALLVPAGTAIMTGLVAGLDAQMPALRRQLAAVTDTIAGTGTSLDVPTLSGASSMRGGTVVQITVNGALDARSVAAQLRSIINSDARIRGAVPLNGTVIA